METLAQLLAKAVAGGETPGGAATANMGLLSQLLRQRQANPRPDIQQSMDYPQNWNQFGQNLSAQFPIDSPEAVRNAAQRLAMNVGPQAISSFKTISPGDSLGPFVAGKDVSNLSSIKASLEPGYVVEHGIQSVPLSSFYGGKRPNLNVGALNDINRSKDLAEQIKQSGRMDPLIVAIDKEGAYVLEGGHRLNAAYHLDATHIPALVVREAGVPAK